ncbi:MAG: DUF4412 domain-containing protein [Bacteroidota bacterium]
MKHPFSILSALYAIILLACTSPDNESFTAESISERSTGESGENHVFPSETGMVSFVHSGTMNGTEIWYWTNWGKKQRREVKTSIEMMGFKTEQNSISVILENKIYGLNEDDKTATLIKSDMAANLQNMKYDDEAFLEKMGGKKVGSETIIGKECVVWKMESMMATVSVWKGLALHSVVEMMGTKNEITADKVDLNYSPSSDLFDVSGYEIKDLGNVEQYMPRR